MDARRAASVNPMITLRRVVVRAAKAGGSVPVVGH
jgi:hypothetical protein